MALSQSKANSIKKAAKALGIDPVDLATVVSYETSGTFDPWVKGPTTQWGTHRGLIQWGEPQRRKYGVTKDMSFDDQMMAAVKYLRDAGVKAGMGILDVYSAINAGGVGLYNRTDANNGGAPGTVRDKVENQMGGHRRKAQRLMAMAETPSSILSSLVPPTPQSAPPAFAGIAESGLLGDPLVPSPSGAIQREMLAGLPGALPAAPIGQVQTASLDPISALPPLNPAPAGNVSRAPLQNLPERAGSAPQTPVERGLLANLPDPLNAAPVGAVERGGMLRDAAYGGDPSLMNAGGFVSPLARDDGSVYFGGEPMAGMAEEFPFVPTGQAGPDGDMQIMIGRNGIGETFPAPMDRTYQPVTAQQEGERPTLDLYDAQTRPVPMIAQAGSVVDQQTAAPVGPVQRGLLDELSAPAGVDAMTTASQNAMTGMPNLDPSQPLDYRGIPIPAQRPPAPLPAPQNIAQYNVAQVEPNTPSMSVPGGFDVWQGRSPYGQATDSSTLSRNSDGTVSRYSEQYDRWDTYNPRTGSWTPGGGPSQTSDINLPSRDRLVDAGKRAGAGAAGGLLGSALLGPIGGLLGATLAKQVIGGEGLLSGNGKRVTNAYPSTPIGVARPNTQSEQQRITATFGYSGVTPGGGDPMSRNYAPAAYDSIEQGKTVGLF